MIRPRIVFALLLAVTPAFACAAAADAPVTTATGATKPARKGLSLPVSGEATLDRIQRQHTIRVGIALNAPWVMHDKSGEPIGYSVDVARQLAQEMGWKLELVTTSWPALLHDLRTDQFDVVISGLSITPQRALQVRFTRPFGEYDIGVVVNRGNFPSGSLNDFAQRKVRLAAGRGTLTVGVAQRAFPLAQIVETDDEAQALADVRNGRLDGYVAEAPMPLLQEKIHPDQLRALTGETIGRSAHGMAMRIGDDELADVLDAWIVEQGASGWLKARQSFWFSGTDWASQL